MIMKLAQIFSSGAVFQAHKPIRIFGTGDENAEIEFDGEKMTAVAKDGRFCVEFSPRPYGGPSELIFTYDGSSTVLTDIYVGEVLLLAGQSNIALKLKYTSYPKEQYENQPLLRIFCGGVYEDEHNFSPDNGWGYCTLENAPDFSAIGYHVGTELCRRDNIAVGLLACALGSTVIESWMPAEIGNRPEFYLPKEEKFESPYVHGPYNRYGTMYELKQQPLVPYSVGNAVWYQGESNSGPSEHKNYTALLAELITCWRRDFCDSSLPFCVVTLADWDARDDAAWHGIQAAQRKIKDVLHNVSVVEAADVCEKHDIHPPTKILLAKRILDTVY